MKNSSLIFFSALILFTGCNSKDKTTSTGYVISGTIKGIPAGTVKLVSYNEDDRTSKGIDSTKISTGGFELKGKLGVPQFVSVIIEPGRWSFSVFVEDTIIHIKADTMGSEYYDYTKYGGDKGAVIKNFTETGSKNFDDWMQYQNNPAGKKYEPVFKELGKKMESTKDVDEEYRYRDQMDSVSKLLNKWKQQQISDYIHKNPSSVAGAYMLRDLYNWYSDLPLGDMESMVAGFSGEAKKSAYYTSLQGIISKRRAVMPGSVAPDFKLRKPDSSAFTLSSSRGKYMMIDFWASWCHPCRKAIPHWKEIYSKYHSKGFDVVSVSDDDKWQLWTKAMDQEKMPWQQVIDEFPVKNMPAKVGSLYMTTYIPFYVLLDKDGKVLVYSGDENKIDAKLKEIFGS